MGNRLSIFEKLYLSWRGYYDAKHGVFQVAVDHGPANKETTVGVDPMESGKISYVLSPFISRELSRYEARREFVLGKKNLLIWLKNKDYRKRYHLTSFASALDEINAQVTLLNTDIRLIYIQFNERMKELKLQRKDHELRNEPHMVQLCVNHAGQLRTAYYNDTTDKYSSIVALLNEKIQILDKTDAKLKSIRARHFLRIRYYYERASSYERQLPIMYLQDDVLRKIANTDTIRGYETELADAHAQLSEFMDEINIITPNNKKPAQSNPQSDE